MDIDGLVSSLFPPFSGDGLMMDIDGLVSSFFPSFPPTVVMVSFLFFLILSQVAVDNLHYEITDQRLDLSLEHLRRKESMCRLLGELWGMDYAQARNLMTESGGNQITTDVGDLKDDDNEEDFDKPPLSPHFSAMELSEFRQDESSLAAADLSCSVAEIMSSERPVFLTEVDLTNL
uniref:Uncharacterized protein n=1 Tax=Chromera velia CCMP2878 TaxID=1169474 RepID=A0A0G4FD59_9ALVE|eukprot:Cvel_16453.t1-p1 / transcript=Cvel_16453.t1 / gene=Cvel_16453 / organism=Chromera_velia_CCMP2878 / gene_product=hypothetical protein / transcript_product=hypothetical protein / location=Cvel_scaffold1268:25793-26493(+) / protein_length=175 / sequence_SO=supercontig / SO=protein_coding / is_pseudo=false